MSKEAEEQRRREQREAYAEQVLTHLFVMGEVIQSDLINEINTIQPELPPFLEEMLKRVKFDATNNMGKLAELTDERSEARIIEALDEPKRESIKRNALGRAIGFWQERLQEPDLSVNEIMIARRRVTRLTARLDALNKGE